MLELGCGIEITDKIQAYKVLRDLLQNDEKENNWAPFRINM